ncbi:MAG: hypothetical protein PHU81_00745 [Acidobacteriota bacterium]|nr:hypothetical protein [Acidobacteriota bacterium]
MIEPEIISSLKPATKGRFLPGRQPGGEKINISYYQKAHHQLTGRLHLASLASDLIFRDYDHPDDSSPPETFLFIDDWR